MIVEAAARLDLAGAAALFSCCEKDYSWRVTVMIENLGLIDMNEAKSRVLEFNLDETEYDVYEYDFEDIRGDFLEFDLAEEEYGILEFDWDEENEGLEFIDLGEEEWEVFRKVILTLPLWRRVAAAVCAFLAAAGAIMIVWITADTFMKERLSEQKVEEIRQQQKKQLNLKEGTEWGGIWASVKNAELVWEALRENPYTDTFSRNDDMIAWLKIEDTVIDYPVMQTMEDEEYYLNRDFYGNEDKAGSLVLDTDSSLDDDAMTTNLIIHGHNMKAGTMFGSLDEYRSEKYYREHRCLELYTRGELRKYEVIAAFGSRIYYSTDKSFKYYTFFHANTEEEFQYFYDNIKNLSIYDTGVTAQPGDNFLTLSTCAYDVKDGRFVVVAKEVERESLR